MAVTKLTLVRTRAGRKPQNVDLDTVREMIEVWDDDPDTGLSDGEVYKDRITAQKVGQAYKGYLEKHYDRKVASVTGANPDGEGFVFSLNPGEDGRTGDTEVIPPDQAENAA